MSCTGMLYRSALTVSLCRRQGAGVSAALSADPERPAAAVSVPLQLLPGLAGGGDATETAGLLTGHHT